ncbi:hypothetical protein GCM10023169_20460 [Georgenia halophila]|uniref:Teneurin-like YD-shell domain-containing protein n=1 Tax=Georgenia halophila TaxID=620889 RepID=A0ABP8L955_9MICO
MLVLVGATAAVAAAPSVPDSLEVELTATHRPVLTARVSDPDGGTVSGQFFARRAGAASWDLIDGQTASGTAGSVVRATLPALPAGARVEWTVKACDAPSSCSAAAPVETTRVSPMLGAGERKSATTVPFQLGDRVQAEVDVGTGNLLITAAGLPVPGVSGDLDVGVAYNSLAVGSGAEQDTASSALGWGWTQLVGYGVTLREGSAGAVVYSGPGGLTGTFVPTGTGGYTAPAGMPADLANTAGGWTLTDHATASVLVFDSAGDLTRVLDRNGNETVITPGEDGAAGSVPEKITGTAGPASARVVHVGTGPYGRVLGLSQNSSGSTTRTVGYGYTGSDLTTITDPLNRTTTLTYVGHRPVRVDAPGGVTTHIAYDGKGRVTMVRQVNTSPGSPGDSITRFAFPTDTQTLMSDPSQEEAGSPTTGLRTTYTLTSDMTGWVTRAVDAQGRERSVTFSPHFDAATQTTGTGTTAGTTTNTYGANDGESLTEQTWPTGAAWEWEYTGTTAATQYSPTSAIDTAGNETVHTYTGAGNPATVTDPGGAQAAVTYHPDGTVATATAPGNAGNPTTYTYNTNSQLTTITPVTGSSLGTRTYTWDEFGRLASETNGRGVTTTYAYDKNGRRLSVDYSTTAAAPDITYTYSPAGQVTTRVDTSGTTTYGHDQLGQLISRSHSAGGGTIAYGYDKAGRLASTTDTRGTTSYEYDTAGALVSMTTQVGTKQTLTNFAVDDHGRRTDTWLATSPDNASWAVHSKTDYDPTGRISRITAERRPESTETPITEVDISYCYTTATTAPTCTGTAQNDRSNLQWQHNRLTDQTTTYTYDTTNRLTDAHISAGTNQDGDPLPQVTYAYAYDTRGNRTSQTVTTGTGAGASTTTQNLTYNPGNQITTAGYAYDGAGNQTTDPAAGTISYTPGDQMATVARAGNTHTYTTPAPTTPNS